jgi:hypothetical protein
VVVSDTERIYSLYVQANPIPDPGLLPLKQDEAELLFIERSRAMDTQERIETRDTGSPRRWSVVAIAFAVVLVVVGAVAVSVLLVGDGGSEAEVAAASELATVEAATAAYNAYDADTYATYWVEGTSGPAGIVVGSPEWQQFLAEEEARGVHITLSGCEATDTTVRCFETYEETRLSGKAGIVITWEVEYTFNQEGRIASHASGINTQGSDAIAPFEDALGRWMAAAHPEAFETYYVPDFYTRKYENWYTPEGAAQLSTLIDEFIAQSETYPLP